MNNIAYNLKRLRISKGWSQKDVAEKIHKSQPAYAQMENGITKIDFDQVEQFAQVFEVEIDELLKNENSKIYNFNSNKIQKQDFIEHYYNGIKDIYEHSLKSLEEAHEKNIKMLKETYDQSLKTIKDTHEQAVKLLLEEIAFLRSELTNK